MSIRSQLFRNSRIRQDFGEVVCKSVVVSFGEGGWSESTDRTLKVSFPVCSTPTDVAKLESRNTLREISHLFDDKLRTV
jgi:hypothetical protein